MNCDQIQPNLLDYGKGLLSQPESEDIAAHLKQCAKCAAELKEEIAFSGRMAALTDEKPENDVWALVRAQTKPRKIDVFAWLRGLSVVPVSIRRTAAVVAAASVVAVTLYSVNISLNHNDQAPVVRMQTHSMVAVKWSDDPVGGQTDAMVDLIDKM